MVRSTRHSKLETRSGRATLPRRRAPYFAKVAQGLQLGYYRGSTGGAWIARRYVGSGRYETDTVGLADDTVDADGVNVMTYFQAIEAARKWSEHRRLADAGVTHKGSYKVSDAVRDYLDEVRAEKSLSAVKNIEYAFNVVLPELGGLEVDGLTYSRLAKWRNELATRAKRVRKKRTAIEQPTRPIAETDDARRARRATANRVLTQLKAALNRAFRAGRIPSDEAWRRVTPFRRVDAAVVRYLSTNECRRLVNACPSDFRRLVQGALLTGCRYGELSRLRCGDFNADSDTLTIRQSKGGKARHVFLTQDARELFLTWTAGRSTTAQIFLRDDGERWGKSHQLRPIADASKAADISPPATFHVLRHTHASHLAMAATPMGVIAAQLGHADTRMVEKHYAHLAPSYVADTIRANLPALGVVGEANSPRPINEAHRDEPRRRIGPH